MKKVSINYLLTTLLVPLLIITSCKKDKVPEKPHPSDFTVQVENQLPLYPASGTKVNVTINAGSNGWWITVPEDGKKWCIPDKLYGSADQTIGIKISPNLTGITREVEVTINPTFGLPPIKLIITQAG